MKEDPVIDRILRGAFASIVIVYVSRHMRAWAKKK